MQIKIKDFKNEGDNKLIGFLCTKEDGNAFEIDRQIALDADKTDEDYISEAYDALGRNGLSAKAEIETWKNTPIEEPEYENVEEEVSENIGKQWSPAGGIS